MTHLTLSIPQTLKELFSLSEENIRELTIANAPKCESKVPENTKAPKVNKTSNIRLDDALAFRQFIDENWMEATANLINNMANNDLKNPLML